MKRKAPARGSERRAFMLSKMKTILARRPNIAFGDIPGVTDDKSPRRVIHALKASALLESLIFIAKTKRPPKAPDVVKPQAF